MSTKHKRIKARRMWCNRGMSAFHDKPGFVNTATMNAMECPVAILDISNPEALIEQVATTLYGDDKNVWRDLGEVGRNIWCEEARAVLESLGIIAKRKAKR